MYCRAITLTRALALLLGGPLLVAALPIMNLDVLWTRINTDRYFDMLERCQALQKESMCGEGSQLLNNLHRDEGMTSRLLAECYQLEGFSIPTVTVTATATAESAFEATGVPCVRQLPQSTTTPPPDLKFGLQRRDDAAGEIPSTLKTQETTLKPIYTPGPLTMYECGNVPCLPYFKTLTSGDRCICLGPFPPAPALPKPTAAHDG